MIHVGSVAHKAKTFVILLRIFIHIEIMVLVPVVLFANTGSALTTVTRMIHPISFHRSKSIHQASKLPFDDDTAKQIHRAKKLLEEAKKKLVSNPSSIPPSSPSQQQQQRTISSSDTSSHLSSINRKDQLIKSTNQETGLFTTDGELMAALSAQEEWEMKRLLEIFDSEMEEESDVSKQIANRDVVSSVRNLKRELQNEDYEKIFDTKNRFIGEDY